MNLWTGILAVQLVRTVGHCRACESSTARVGRPRRIVERQVWPQNIEFSGGVDDLHTAGFALNLTSTATKRKENIDFTTSHLLL